jgi:hypothetical protein
MDEKVKEIEKSRKPLLLQDMGPVTIQQLEPNYNAEYVSLPLLFLFPKFTNFKK